MYVWIIWLLVALTGASLAQLIRRDKITDGIRERWEAHWEERIEQSLFKVDGLLNIAGMHRGERDPEKMGKLRTEMYKRASKEPGVRFWMGRERREELRPWSTKVAEISRLESYMNFPSCRDCLPYWPYLALTALTLGWAFEFDVIGAVAMGDTLTVSPWYAGFVVLFEIPLALRWIYAQVDRD